MKVEARSVSWSVAGRSIVDDVTLESPEGGVLGLLGPNGSGKTTLLRMLSGQVSPRAGEVVLDDRPITSFSRREIATRMAVLEQHSSTDDDLTARDVIDLGRIPHRPLWSGGTANDTDIVMRAASRVGVDDLLARQWRTLSGGEQQRVQLARALAQEPSVLLLDEPTNHLDIRAQMDILALAGAAPATVVIALHDLNLAATFCDEILLLRKGRAVARGAPEEVLTAELIGEVYGVDAVVEATVQGVSVRYLPPQVRW